MDETSPLQRNDDLVDTEACCAVSEEPVVKRSSSVRRALGCGAALAVAAVVAVTASDRFHPPEKKTSGASVKAEFTQLMEGMNSWQCNYVCGSDADCNSLTGPCIYCSSKGSGSAGTCVSEEDDTGGTGLNGDDDTVFSKKKSNLSVDMSPKKYDVLLNAWQCNYVCSSDADCNSLTGPCVYCSSKGDGSGGTCVSDEDDKGGTGLNGDDDTVFSKKDKESGTDDTTKTNVWHHHAHSTTCVSDEDCSSEYTCESGQCVPYQPDTKAFAAAMKTGKDMNSWQCNYVCSSDSDCNSLTGPCTYCSSKGSGSAGTCVSEEDDTGGTGLNGDDDTVFSKQK